MNKESVDKLADAFRRIFHCDIRVDVCTNGYGDNLGPEVIVGDDVGMCYNGKNYLTWLVDAEEDPETFRTFDEALVDMISMYANGQAEDLLSGKLDDKVDQEILRELKRAEDHFSKVDGGFVGEQYFIVSWKGRGIPSDPRLRHDAITRLLDSREVQAYDVRGKTALRTVD